MLLWVESFVSAAVTVMRYSPAGTSAFGVIVNVQFPSSPLEMILTDESALNFLGKDAVTVKSVAV